jgi:KDO2-lipid IV(A) lauroyltransferase
MQHRLEFLLFLIIRRFVLILPLRSAQRLGAYLGDVGYLLLRKRRVITLDNLRHAFPEKSDAERTAIARGAFRNFGIAITELLWFPNLTDATLQKLVRPTNLELLNRGYARGKGMVMLSGHFGNWELIALAVARLCGLPFTIIVQTQSNQLVDEVINRHRCLFGNRVVPMGMSVREIIRTLQQGGIVAIAPDQSGPMEGVFVDFFGRTVATHQGPAVFALRSGAPMQIGFIIRQGDGTYKVELEEIPTDDLVGHSEENVVELTRRHTAVLERYIRQYPEHWLWMHRRWKHTWEGVQRDKQIARTINA